MKRRVLHETQVLAAEIATVDHVDEVFFEFKSVLGDLCDTRLWSSWRISFHYKIKS